VTNESPWLTADEAAARAQVGVRLIYRSVAAGTLKAARVGGRRALRFRAEYIDAWLEASSTPVIVDTFRRGAA
jgi:excisionase family DNA binding protein